MELIKSFSLALISMIMLIIAFTISLILEIIFAFKNRSTARLSVLFMGIAMGGDLTGNVVARYLLNKMFVKPGGYQHGDIHQTISRILGLNKQSETLTGFGRFMGRFLHLLDPDHIVKAAQSEIEEIEIEKIINSKEF